MLTNGVSSMPHLFLVVLHYDRGDLLEDTLLSRLTAAEAAEGLNSGKKPEAETPEAGGFLPGLDRRLKIL